MNWLRNHRSSGQEACTKSRRDDGPCVEHFLVRFFDVLVSTSPGREDEIREVQQAVQDTQPGKGSSFGAWLVTPDEGGLLSILLLCARQLGPGIVKQACKRCLPSESCVNIFDELDKPDPSYTPTISPDLEQAVATAVTQGDLRGVRTLVNDRGLNAGSLPFHVHSKSKDSLLALAAAHGRLNVLRYMMDSALQVDFQAAQRREVFTAISVAASRGRLNPVILLRQYWTGPAPDHSLANSPLHLSCLSGCEDLVRHLVEAREGGSVEETPYSPPRFGRGTKSSLRSQATRGFTSVLGSVLTESGVGSLRSDATLTSDGSRLTERKSLFPVLQVESTGGRLPLHLACSGGHVSIVRLLFEKGGREGQLNAADHRGVTPLMEACKAAKSVSLLEFLLAQEGLCVDVASRNGYTALRYCVQAGWAAGTHLLLAKGRADPEVADQDGITPLQAAVTEGHAGLVSLLRQYGATLCPSSPAFAEAYRFAACREDVNVLEALLAHESNGPSGNGSSKNSRAAALRLVLHRGCYNGSVEIVSWARKKGARVEEEGEAGEGDGLTPLATAARAGHINVVRYLVEQAGVEVRQMDRVGKRAQDYAAERHRHDVVKYLTQQSASQAHRPGRKPKPSESDGPSGGSSCSRKRSIAALLRPLAGHSDSSSSLKVVSSEPAHEAICPRPRSLSDSFWGAPSLRSLRSQGPPAGSEDVPPADATSPPENNDGPPSTTPSADEAPLPSQPQLQPELQGELQGELQPHVQPQASLSSLPSVSTLSCASHHPSPPKPSASPSTDPIPTWEVVNADCRASIGPSSTSQTTTADPERPSVDSGHSSGPPLLARGGALLTSASPSFPATTAQLSDPPDSVGHNMVEEEGKGMIGWSDENQAGERKGEPGVEGGTQASLIGEGMASLVLDTNPKSQAGYECGGQEHGNAVGEEEQKGGADVRVSVSAPPAGTEAPSVQKGSRAADGLIDVREQKGSRAADGLIDVKELLCPISSVLMTDPVVASDGYSYQRQALTAMIDSARRRGRTPMSPVTGEPLTSHPVPNSTLRAMVQHLISSRSASEMEALLSGLSPSPSTADAMGGEAKEKGKKDNSPAKRNSPVKGNSAAKGNSPAKGPGLVKRTTESTVSMDTVSTGYPSIRRVGLRRAAGTGGERGQAGERRMGGDKDKCLIM